MLEFSTSAILDGLIHLGAFIIKSLVLYVLLSLMAKDKFESHFFRTVLVIGSLALVKVYAPQVEWLENIILVVAICYAVSFLLHLLILKTSLLVACVSSLLIGGVSLGLDHVAVKFSAKVIPEGPRFAEYMGLAQQAVEQNKADETLKPTEIGLVDVMRKGLDALATLTEEEQMEAMQEDFNRGMALFAERKAWMDSLTPEEKRAYREEMAAFLAEQGIASDRYSLAAIKDVNPTNLVALSSLFSELQNEDIDEEVRIRSIPESLGALALNLSGAKLGDRELGMLQNFAELFAKDEIQEAIDQARKDLEDAQGNNELAGAVLAALVQTKSGLPADQLFTGDEGASLLNPESLKSMAARHWKSKGLDPEVQWKTGTGSEVDVTEVTEIIVEDVEVEEIPDKQPEPFISITTGLGIVSVPTDPLMVNEWVSASQILRMKGFVSLGNELVILRDDGKMLRKNDVWSIEHLGQIFSFRIDSIEKGKVVLVGERSEPVSAE